MVRLVPGIRILARPNKNDVDGPTEPGHHGKENRFPDSIERSDLTS
jgi:hypothetical protein